MKRRERRKKKLNEKERHTKRGKEVSEGEKLFEGSSRERERNIQ